MVRFEAVGKDYGEIRALGEVSFELRPGEITGLLGPNGAGKTTAMRIMTGFLAPTRGAVYLEGQPFDPDTVEARRRIGYLPESASLYTDMLAWDYLVYEARVHGLDPDRRVPEVIRQVGLESHAHMPIRQLSRGFRQRTGLAHALLHDPDLLILDEPTSGLDPNQILEVRTLIRRIAATKTVILSTHIMQEVEALCHRVLVIHRGEIRYDGPIAQFSAAGRPSSGGAELQQIRLIVAGVELPELRDLLRDIPGFLELEEVPLRAGDRIADAENLLHVRLTVESPEDARPAVFRLAAGADITAHADTSPGPGARFVIYEMTRERTSLEDVFHALTRETVAGASPRDPDEDEEDAEQT